MTILAGDIGGTKILLQITTDRTHRTPLSILFERRYLSAHFSSFDELLAEFLDGAQQAGVPMPSVVCVGVAGPVVVDNEGNASAKVTNLPWLLDENKLLVRFKFRKVHLLNDFQAIGYGLDTLAENELIVLQAGENPSQIFPQPRVLIGAGTGLGQGVLVWKDAADQGYYDVLCSEGGHGDFSPGSPDQVDLLNFLLQKNKLTKSLERVSLEDVLSGRGLVNLYYYFAHKYPEMVNPEMAQSMLKNDAAAVVSEAALTAKDSLADQALNMFVEIYGGQAGNLALTCLARGGVYIAGGIAPKIQSRMQSSLFLKAFQNKGPMAEMMKSIPVTLVMNQFVGLKGALLVASRL